MFWLRNKKNNFQFCRLDTITFGWSIKHFKGFHLFMSPKSVFALANSRDPDEMFLSSCHCVPVCASNTYFEWIQGKGKFEYLFWLCYYFFLMTVNINDNHSQ